MDLGDSGSSPQRTVRMSRGHSISEELPIGSESVAEVEQEKVEAAKPEAVAEEPEEDGQPEEAKTSATAVDKAFEPAPAVAEPTAEKDAASSAGP